MDFRDTPDEAAFRQGLREWLAANVPEGWGAPGHPEPQGDERVAFYRDWSKRLYEAGFVGLTWPTAYGGYEQPISHQVIALEEFARSEAPEHANVIGLGMAGPTILAHGTEAQRERYLRRILTAEDIWCQGFSEPGAGSDLASLTTRAVRDGDDYVVNGQKVWSSFAHVADYCILVTRTDPSAPKHQGLTYFVLDMHLPGVEVRPLRQLTGDSEFNEIFLTDVRIPAADVIGLEGQGWTVAITTLMNERASLGVALTVRLEVALRHLVELAKATKRDGGAAADDPLVRDRIAGLWTKLQALRFTNYRAYSRFLATGVPGPEGSIAKLVWSETNQALTKMAVEIEGPFAALSGGEHSVLDGRWQHLQLRSRGNTIEGGTSEILRNIIAERVLSLPKGR
ncbi:MAG TPA: acyl-CoA dehydrogenase family protein [Actinomycetota bacterium]|jgi:alkylation response protein AidB-like acyl-CoA dehydrogenase